MTAAETVVVATDIGRDFDGTMVLDGVDLTLTAGEVVALLGTSGSGKSTLLRILAGLDDEATGRHTTSGRSAVVFQEHRLLPWKRVADNVALGMTGPQVRSRAAQALAEVDLAGRERSWPAELSGGQAQRVAFARALIREPGLLLLDEPFGALDALTRLRMQGLFRRLHDQHRFAALLVTHDVDEAVLLADRVLILDAGKISDDVTIDLEHPRAPDQPGFGPLRRHLLARLGVTSG
jgi:sulfonate transport system ATP-binding protein